MWYSPHFSPTSGFPLRYCLTALMADQPNRVWTVAELVTTIERHGIVTDGRPSKVISDSLRREVFKGRVKRVGRGQYVFAGAPDSTMRRIRRYARLHLGHDL